MNKFFGIEKRPNKKQEEDNEVKIQGYITPSGNRFINNQNNNEPETFVYQGGVNNVNNVKRKK